MSPISNSFYILAYILRTSWTGRLEHINGRVINDLCHLITLNDILLALGVEPMERDEYLTVRR